MSFKQFNFDQRLQDGLEAMNFHKPTPVQELAIPSILTGQDVIAVAQTGTGKTAAYLLPTIHQIATKEHTDTQSIKALVLAPTRELAAQIDQQLEGFGYFLPVSSLAIYGGGSGDTWDQQKRALKEGAEIVIATPGRLIQHLNLGYVKLDELKHLILDEADRMLDMGFIEDIKLIINHLPVDRQNLMFSATMPGKVRSLAATIMKDPKEISIAISKPAERILQGAFMAYDNQKVGLISMLLKGKTEELPSVIIFCATKKSVKVLEKELKRQEMSAAAIHSDLDQKEREEVLLGFKNRKFQVLIATDIVSRGIDIENISMVVNFDVPRDPEDYVHRIGRTARAEAKGMAVTLINEDDIPKFHRIERLIEKEIKKVPTPENLGPSPAYDTKRKSSGGQGRSNGRGGKRKPPRK